MDLHSSSINCNNNFKNISISLASIQAKALKFTLLKENCNYKETEKRPFSASKGWFHHFRRRHELTHVDLSGESAVKYAPRFHRLVTDSGCEKRMEMSRGKEANKTSHERDSWRLLTTLKMQKIKCWKPSKLRKKYDNLSRHRKEVTG